MRRETGSNDRSVDVVVAEVVEVRLGNEEVRDANNYLLARTLFLTHHTRHQ